MHKCLVLKSWNLFRLKWNIIYHRLCFWVKNRKVTTIEKQINRGTKKLTVFRARSLLKIMILYAINKNIVINHILKNPIFLFLKVTNLDYIDNLSKTNEWRQDFYTNFLFNW